MSASQSCLRGRGRSAPDKRQSIVAGVMGGPQHGYPRPKASRQRRHSPDDTTYDSILQFAHGGGKAAEQARVAERPILRHNERRRSLPQRDAGSFIMGARVSEAGGIARRGSVFVVLNVLHDNRANGANHAGVVVRATPGYLSPIRRQAAWGPFPPAASSISISLSRRSSVRTRRIVWSLTPGRAVRMSRSRKTTWVW